MEFRTILAGMMEACRAEGDVLVISKRMLDRDVFETVEMAARARAGTSCAGCRRPLMPMPARERERERQRGAVRWAEESGGEEPTRGREKITIMRNGVAYHGSCLPP